MLVETSPMHVACRQDMRSSRHRVLPEEGAGKGSRMNPTLAQLRRLHPFEIPVLAAKAGVGNRVVYAMLRGFPVEQVEAERVLAALAALLESEWKLTLKTVDVVLKEG